jgi:dihydrofolate reductase
VLSSFLLIFTADIFSMTISIIVAAAENNAIGKNNQLLWRLPNDLKFFKNTTWGMPVIMGRKTFESVSKPLPGRFNIVITRQTGWKADGVIVAADLNDALAKAAETNCKEAFIIGGGEIYAQAMEMAHILYLNRVHTVIEEADTFFPAVDEHKWEMVSIEEFEADLKHAYAYSFQKWLRK